MIRYLVRLCAAAPECWCWRWGYCCWPGHPLLPQTAVEGPIPTSPTNMPGSSPVAGTRREEVEQQVTIPIEIQMNGVGHLVHLRSLSLAGLSFITLIFDDESENLQNRQQVLEKLTMVTLPAESIPDRTRFSPAGQIYWYTLVSSDPKYDTMELKTLQDWVVYKYLMSVPNVAAVSIFGGETKEYQVQIDPDKLAAYGFVPGERGAGLGSQQR